MSTSELGLDSSFSGQGHYSRNPNFENFVDNIILSNLGKGVGYLDKELGQVIDNINFVRDAGTFYEGSNKKE